MGNEINLRTAKNGDTLIGLITEKLTEENGGKKVNVNSVWNKILDVVDEQQQENGDVYKGGSERKNWGKNYVIFVGQAIKFSQAMWDKIKELVGIKTDVTVNESQNSEETDAVAQTSTQNSVIQNGKPVLKDTNIPQNMTVPPTTVPSKKVEPPQTQIPEDLTQYDMELINTRHEELAGVTTKDAFGRLIAYDEKGYLCTIEDKTKNTKTIINRNDNNSLKYMSQVTKDSNGNEIKDIHWKANGELEWYSEKEYDGKNLTREIQHGNNGDIEEWKEYEGERNEPSKEIFRNSDGELDYYKEFPDGYDGYTPREEITRNANGDIISWTGYENGYDKTIYRTNTGEVSGYCYYLRDDTQNLYNADYDSEGNLVAYSDTNFKMYDANGSEISNYYETNSILPNGVNKVETPWRNEAQQLKFRVSLNQAKNILLEHAESLGLSSKEIEIIQNVSIESIDFGPSRADKEKSQVLFNINADKNIIDEPNVGFFVQLLLHETNHISEFPKTESSKRGEERACERRAIKLAYNLLQQGVIDDYTIPCGTNGFKLSSLSTDEQIENYISTWINHYYSRVPE